MKSKLFYLTIPVLIFTCQANESLGNVYKPVPIISGYTPIEPLASLELPTDFYGEWSSFENLENCGFGFFIIEEDGNLSLSNGTEWGGYNSKSKKIKDYYQIDFIQSSEGESWESKILLKMVGDNLFVSFSGLEDDFQKMYRCPN